MRPVNRGIEPIDESGNKKTFSHYSEARSDLIDRLGEFCSYCEMHLDSALAVEHIMPKSEDPKKERDWNNFLLACPNCNSTKGKTNIILDDYFWPHRDNTFMVLAYKEGGRITPSDSLNEQQRIKAQKTLDLTGFLKIKMMIKQKVIAGGETEGKPGIWL